ncbi:MAG TPA: 16S rRNA (cytidine(1402)-2'-O)-methyltransferase [Bacillota bacterium]|jgi:16S rRNA (cytidine1402-2'-O)-methyltransferase
MGPSGEPVDRQAEAASYTVYLVRCADGTYYAGLAKDLDRRLAAHDEGKGARYTRGRGPVTLVASRAGLTHRDAARLEQAWKSLPREEKAALSESEAAATGETAPGLLYLCGTPIGNLGDLSPRAVQILSSVEYVAAEDTRRTRALLAHEGISRRVVSYHEHNKRSRGPAIIEDLRRGKSVALVTDAGLPGISDPGEDLVHEAVAAGLTVVPVPGPSAALTALVASGLPTTPFTFAGFVPRVARERREVFRRLIDVTWTTVFYEAPHRLAECLTELGAVLGDRPIVVARELTKVHETFHRGTAAVVLAELHALFPEGKIRGEACLVVAGRPATPTAGPPLPADLRRLVSEQQADGLSKKEAIKRVAVMTGLGRRQVYAACLSDDQD